jgi:hypothetical protein
VNKLTEDNACAKDDVQNYKDPEKESLQGAMRVNRSRADKEPMEYA